MQLTFENGKFKLLSISPVHIRYREISAHDSNWQFDKQTKNFETKNLGEAKAFRYCADAKAEKVFKRSLAVDYDIPCLPPLKFLDKHQREGILWVLSRSRTYLAHAPGAGKTCQAIVSACMIPKKGATLFIVPPTLTVNWEREVLKFCGLLGYHPSVAIVPVSSKRNLMNWSADFIICPDSMLTKDWVYSHLLKLNPKFIAVDEASRFKEPFSQRSKAFYGGNHGTIFYPGIFHDALYTVLLDGSPMPNRPIELWAPAYALDPECIDYLGYFSFGHRYCGAKIGFNGEWEFKGSSNESELKSKLQKKFMHVVSESELNHPERMRSILHMNENILTPTMREWERQNVKSYVPENLDEGQMAEMRRKIGLGKVPWISKYIREKLKDKNESILLFAWHREVCENLAALLDEFKPHIIYGGISNEEREKAFKDFQSGKTKLIIGNIQAMGRGHNLQRADRVVFAEYSWTDELNKQCEKRASRRGNTKKFTKCEYIVASDSIMDEFILRAVFTKADRVRKVIGE